ncbi:MAG: hypothetical protein B6I38_05650 [Anaerolineaceae bacterium 4572_5.1]|nr:MAG: hypothetical protein B6I38_05650 [Anaerolineaceae bacterium 4572_5.1]
MKRFDMRIVFGLVLIVAGFVFLLESIGIFHGGVGLLWAVILGGAGLTSLYVYVINRDNWWALIPGFTLTAIGASVGLDVILPSVGNFFGGAIILGGIGLAFWAVYFTNREFWWSIIPAGALTSLAVVSLLDNIFPKYDTGGFFLVGLGLTFILLGVLPGYGDRLKWAFIPGGILTLIGVISLPFMDTVFNILWPLALIAAGGYVIYKNFKN